MRQIYSRDDLAVSCFGMTRVEAIQNLSDYSREFDEFIQDPANEDFIRSREDEFCLIKPFISKAMNYLKFNYSSVSPKDDYEKRLLEEIVEKLL